MLSCSSRLGHLLTAFTWSAASGSPSITPPWASNCSNFLSSAMLDDFLGQRDDVFAAPNQRQRAFGAFERRRQPRAFGRPAGQAVLDHQQVNVLLAQLAAAARRSCRSSGRSRRPAARRSTPSSRLRRSFGNQVFDEFAHDDSLLSMPS